MDFQAAPAALNVEFIVGVIIAVATIAGQTVAALKYLAAQFAKRDEALTRLGDTLDAALDEMRKDAIVRNEATRAEFARIDRDIGSIRHDIALRLAQIPTRGEIDTMLQQRVGPLESQWRSLTLELARAGVRITVPPG